MSSILLSFILQLYNYIFYFKVMKPCLLFENCITIPLILQVYNKAFYSRTSEQKQDLLRKLLAPHLKLSS